MKLFQLDSKVNQISSLHTLLVYLGYVPFLPSFIKCFDYAPIRYNITQQDIRVVLSAVLIEWPICIWWDFIALCIVYSISVCCNHITLLSFYVYSQAFFSHILTTHLVRWTDKSLLAWYFVAILFHKFIRLSRAQTYDH